MHIITFLYSFGNRGVWGTSYHLALVELVSHSLLASLSLSLFSLSGALPCGVARWYGVLWLGAKVRSRAVFGFETLDLQRLSHEGRSVAGAGR